MLFGDVIGLRGGMTPCTAARFKRECVRTTKYADALSTKRSSLFSPSTDFKKAKKGPESVGRSVGMIAEQSAGMPGWLLVRAS